MSSSVLGVRRSACELQRRGSAATSRPPRRARRWRCRAACSRAGDGPRASPPPRAHRRCSARDDALRSASAVPGESSRSRESTARRSTIFCSRRASARSFSMCLNSSCVVEPTTRSWPVVRIGLMSVARSIVPPVVAPAPTVEWISSMNRMGIGRFDSALMTALNRSSKSPRNRVPASSAPVSSEKTSAPFEQIGNVVASEQPRGQSFGERRLADAGVADEHRVVLPPPAQNLHRPLQFVGPADQRIELAGPGARGQVRRVRAQRIARRWRCRDRRCRPRRPAARRPRRLPGSPRRELADAVRDVLEHVEAGDALRRE